MENQGNLGRESLDEDKKQQREMLITELEQLKTGIHDVYIQREQQLRKQLNETLEDLQSYRNEQLKSIEREYHKEILAATEEFQQQAFALQQKLILDLEHQKKLIIRDYQLSRICQDDHQLDELMNNQRELRSTLRLFQPDQGTVSRRTVKLNTMLSKAEIEEDLQLIGQIEQ